MDAKLKQQLERIPPDALNDFVKGLQRHSYSARLDAHHSISVRSILGGSCSKTDLILLSGRDETGSAGKAKILIDSLLCGVMFESFPSGVSLVMVREPHFVATPHSSAPVFVTVQTSSTLHAPHAGSVIVDRDGNSIDQGFITSVEVNITSWKHDGNPAPKTTFAWICTIEAARQMLFE
jgi:hypothetical protein